MLNLDLSQHNPVQSDSQYANVPLPSAHLVVIEESEMKESVKDGFTKGTNLLLEMTILASSCGNEFVGEKLPLYIPISGFEETAIRAGMKRLSTLAHTLGLGTFLQNKEDLHGQNFIIVLEKQKNSNFPSFKRILNAQGMEIADASGNFRPCELKDTALQVELDKLLSGGGAVAPANNAQHATTPFANQQPQQPQQSYVPNQQFGQAQPIATGSIQAQNLATKGVVDQTAQSAPQGNFGQAQAQPAPQQGFGNVPASPAWGTAVNPQNGQSA